MMNCEHLRAQLLGYLYDLLENDEKQVADAHLASCEGCQAALAAARRQQRLLATAAKSAFPNVQFERPKSIPLDTDAPRQTKRPFPSRFHFALAASLLITAGLGIPALWFGWTAHNLQDRLSREQTQLAAVQNTRQSLIAARNSETRKIETELEAVRKAQSVLNQDEDSKWSALKKRVTDQQLQLSIVGPETLQAGAENNYTVRTRNLQNEELTAQLSAKVVDQSGKVFFEIKDQTTLGDYPLRLPADLPVTPGSKLSLDLVAKKDGQTARTLHQKIELAAPIYLSHLATDKPMYRPGETVHYRSLTLERFSLKPVQEELRLQFAIKGPQGDEVFQQSGASRLRKADGALLVLPDGKPVAGVGAGQFLIPPGIAGGEYTLVVREANNRFPEQERKFIVNNFANPRLNKELDFTRKSYGPGQEVVAACSATRAEGGPVANRPVVASMYIDGKPYGPDGKEGARSLTLQTDALGKVNVRFKLPDTIERGHASLNVAFNDGGSVESLIRTVPIALKKLMVEFFPEGGDLIAGGVNHVYFQARTTLGKPAELKGHIVDERGTTVVPVVATLHDDAKPGVNQGMGQFAFTPVMGHTYQLKIDEPTGMEGTYALPAVRNDGVLLHVDRATDGKLPVQLTSMGKDRNLLVGVYCRGRLLDSQTVAARKDVATTVEMKPSLPTGGVFRVTAFEELPPGTAKRLAPRAERLVYRQPANALSLSAKLNQEQYIPGDRVHVGLFAQNARKEAKVSVAMAAVVDKSVLTLADEKTFRSMPTHYYLGTEIRRPEDLEFADFLVGPDAKAPEALDLLLGTQGWRRFAEQNPEQFRKEHQEDADRLLLTTGQSPPVEVDMAKQEALLLRDSYALRTGEVESKRKLAEKELADLRKPENPLEIKIREADKSIADAAAKVKAVDRETQSHWQELYSLQDYVLPGLALLSLTVIGMGIVLGFARRGRRGWKWYGVALVSAIILGGVLIPEFLQDSTFPTHGGRFGRKPGLFSKVATNLAVEGRVEAPAVELADRPAPMDAKMQREEVERREPAPAAKPPGEIERRGLWRDKDDPANPGRLEQGNQGAKNAPAARFRGARPMGDARPAAIAPASAAPPAPASGGPENQQRPASRSGEPMKAKASAAEAKDGQMRDDAAKMDALAVPLALPRGTTGNASRSPLQPQIPGMQDARKENKEDRGRKFEFGSAQVDKKAAVNKKELQANQPEVGAFKSRAQGEALLQLQKQAMPLPTPQAGNLDGAQLNALGGMGGPAGGIPGAGVGGRAGGFGGGKDAAAGAALRQERFNRKDAEAPGAHMFDEAEFRKPAPVPEPMLVREYAHVHAVELTPGERKDFVDTVYWHPALVLPDGKVEFGFQLGDAVTSYQLLVFAHTADGNLGSLTKTFEARLPFTLEPKLPLEVTAGDRIDMPVSVANNTPESRSIQIQLETANMNLVRNSSATEDARLDLAADKRGRSLFAMQPAIAEGEALVTLTGRSGPFRDRVVRRVPVVPQGFPVVQARSDLLEKSARQQLVLPNSWIPGTLRCQVQVYPSTLAALQQGLEGLLREPNGCFEQTSTTNYPNLLILDYLRENGQTKPELEKRVRELLANGYNRLTSFECFENGPGKRRGYEWFGGPTAPHEALTAYGLLQFRDMARVYDVDKSMLERTQQYLMSRKDGKGGFNRNARSLDHFGRAPQDITNAYIVWALTESGKQDDVQQELDALALQAQSAKDPYFLGLVAISLLNRERPAEALTLLKKLVGEQKEDGHLEADRTSITGSGGRDLQIETTALAVLGWLKANRPAEFTIPLQKAVRWIGQQRGGHGAFGSTQSTILALKALIAYTRQNKRNAEPGELKVAIANQTIAGLTFPAGAQDVLTLEIPEAAKHLHAGKNDVQISITGQNQFPYTLTWSYQVEAQPSEPGCVVQVKTQLDRTEVLEGEAVHLNVTLQNLEAHGQSMTVAIVGLPGGLTLPEDMKQLKDHCRLREDGAQPGLIGAWEIRGRELILYWRELAPNQKIDVPIDLVARVPGLYTGPASRAYLYYNSDKKNWIKPLKVEIQAKLP